jgi:hypothetical protein
MRNMHFSFPRFRGYHSSAVRANRAGASLQLTDPYCARRGGGDQGRDDSLQCKNRPRRG